MGFNLEWPEYSAFLVSYILSDIKLSRCRISGIKPRTRRFSGIDPAEYPVFQNLNLSMLFKVYSKEFITPMLPIQIRF